MGSLRGWVPKNCICIGSASKSGATSNPNGEKAIKKLCLDAFPSPIHLFIVFSSVFNANLDQRNPKIIKQSGNTVSEEGCLSVIDFRGEIERAEKITLEYQDIKGKNKTLEADGMMSICLQHEIDHLNGILFIDHLPFLKQKMVKKRLSKIAKELA